MKRDELRNANANAVGPTIRACVNGALQATKGNLDKLLKKLDQETERMSKYGKNAKEELEGIERAKRTINEIIGEVNKKML